ncbi:MAG: hypothetical protein ACRDD8_04425 [Bacteroidales bacterium]
MTDLKKKLWYERHRLDDDDNLELVKEYVTVHFVFKDYHVRVHLGELGLIVSDDVANYCIVPNRDEMCMEIYKKDILSSKGKEKWHLKRNIVDTQDGWYDSLKFIRKPQHMVYNKKSK